MSRLKTASSVRNILFSFEIVEVKLAADQQLLPMSTISPKVSSNSFLVHLPHQISPQPLHITITQLLPSTSILLHITANRNQPRLSDVFVVSMPRGADVVSSRLEGLGGLDDDIDRLARLLGLPLLATYSDL